MNEIMILIIFILLVVLNLRLNLQQKQIENISKYLIENNAMDIELLTMFEGILKSIQDREVEQ